MNKSEIVDRYFQEHRAKLLDIAAFLDRIDRCNEDKPDFRIDALLKCVDELKTTEAGRVERILLLLSDQTTTPVEHASEQGASGAVPPKS